MPETTNQLADQVSGLVFAHPARILDLHSRLAADADWEIAADTLMKLARKAAPDPSIFESEGRAPYFSAAEISSGRLDSYFTRMAKSSLKNYAKDADRGVAVLPGHDHNALPYGYSLRGQYFEPSATDPESGRVVAHAYMIPGLTLSGYNTTDVIDGIKAGIIRDVSIGFHGGEYICSICGKDMLRDWSCWHWPGMEYGQVEGYDPKTGQAQKSEDKVLCTATVENAGLSEFSHVYDGATPNAMILRAQFAITERALDIKPEMIATLERRYRCRLPQVTRSFGGVDVQPQAAERKAGAMPPEATTNPGQPQVEPERQAPTPTPLPTSDPAFAVRSILDAAQVLPDEQDLVARVRHLVAENARLTPLAKDGTALRTKLIAATCEQGIRALGADFKREAAEADLKLLTIEQIEQRHMLYSQIADKVIPAGRSSNEPEQAPADANQQPTTRLTRPAWAYQG